jgi:hypothetical protein
MSQSEALQQGFFSICRSVDISGFFRRRERFYHTSLLAAESMHESEKFGSECNCTIVNMCEAEFRHVKVVPYLEMRGQYQKEEAMQGKAFFLKAAETWCVSVVRTGRFSENRERWNEGPRSYEIWSRSSQGGQPARFSSSHFGI